MLSTALKEVGGYFDKRVMVSAFFPSLIAWGAVAASVISINVGTIKQVIDKWKDIELAGQAVLVLAFFAWVMFWAFLTANFRLGVIRFFEGYQAATIITVMLRLPVAWVFWLGSKFGEKSRRKNRLVVDSLSALQREKENYLAFWPKFVPGIEPPGSTPADPLAAAQAIQEYFKRTAIPLKSANLSWLWARVIGTLSFKVSRRLRTELICDRSRAGDSRLLEFGRDARKLRLDVPSHVAAVAQADRLNRLSPELDALLHALDREVTRRIDALEPISNDAYLLAYRHYPPISEPVMPTRLGNVLRSAEAYAAGRYGLDSVLVWPRLMPHLPKAFAASLDEAETSLYLMITVSAFTLLFGIPLTAVTAIWGTASWDRLPRFLTVAGVATGVVFFARLTYLGAIAAALAYGEKVRAAVDLYRLKVLEAMGLKIPPDLEREKETWKGVNEFIYFMLPFPDATCRYLEDENVYEKAKKVHVPKTVLPAGTTLSANNLEEKSVNPGELSSSVVTGKDELANLVPLRDLKQGKPISAWDLNPGYAGPAASLAIRLPATVLASLNLRPGEKVDLRAIPPTGSPSGTQPVVYADQRVVDVKPAGEREKIGVLVVAVPEADLLAIMAAIDTKRLLCTRKLS